MSSEQRPAEPGDLCTCGRQAVVVYAAGRFGEVGHCGVEGAASDPVLPCPWCGAVEAHTQSYGGPARCPDYTLRLEV